MSVCYDLWRLSNTSLLQCRCTEPNPLHPSPLPPPPLSVSPAVYLHLHLFLSPSPPLSCIIHSSGPTVILPAWFWRIFTWRIWKYKTGGSLRRKPFFLWWSDLSVELSRISGVFHVVCMKRVLVYVVLVACFLLNHRLNETRQRTGLLEHNLGCNSQWFD